MIEGVHVAAVVVLSLGSVLEVLGLVIGAIGFRRTWREFSTGGRLFERDFERIRRLKEAALRAARHLLRRPQSAVVPPVTATATVGPSLTLNWGTRFGSLPSPVADPEAFAAEVERRINLVHGQVQSAVGRLTSEAKDREEANERLDQALKEGIARVEGMTRSVAIGGLRDRRYSVGLASLLDSSSKPLQTSCRSQVSSG